MHARRCTRVATVLLVLAGAGPARAQATTAPAPPGNAGERPRLSFPELERGFASPSMLFAPFAFWFWDAPLDPDQTARMAEEMSRQGLNPGYAHARLGLPPEQWLSPLWFEAFGAALAAAEKSNAFLGFCDEYWWPSGQANGRVLAAHPELAAVSLDCRTFDVPEGRAIELPESFFTVAARHAEPFTPPPPRPRLGQWIWCEGAEEEGRSAWFRCTVTAPAGAGLSSAALVISADNRFVLHVNGARVAEGADWMQPAVVDLKPHLREGQNVLAIEATNEDGPCGLIFGLRIDLADGSSQEIGSGPGCRTAAAAPAGWSEPDFDDGAWTEPVVLGEAGADPWRLPAAGSRRAPAVIRSSTLRVIGAEPAFAWQPDAGSWRVYSFAKAHHPGIDGGEVNYLDRRLIPAFLEIAHAPYVSRLASQLGRSIPGVFVDNEGDYGFKLAWSDDLEREHRERTGSDIRSWMPLLLDRDVEGRWPKARWDWYCSVSDLYADNYLGGVSRWLAERGMYCISNLWEESLSAQAFAVGDFFQAQRSVTMPGNDCLVRKALEVHDFKETQSVSEFEGRRFQSEVLGVAGWEMSPVLMKQAMNAVIAWGVSHVVPHGINLNRQLATIPYPPDWFTSNPYWRHLRLWTDFCRRACFVNSCGHAVPDVLLLNPMDSVWALLGGRVFDPEEPVSFGTLASAQVDTGEPGPALGDIEAVYRRAIEELTAARVQYLIADRRYLAQMSVDEGGRLVRGPFAFRALVVPSTFLLPLESMETVLAFAAAGGTVYLLGELPRASSEAGLDDPRMKDLADRLLAEPTVHRSPEGVAALVSRGAAHLRPQVEFEAGAFALLDLHRRIDGRDFFWLANNGGEQVECVLSFRDAKGAAFAWDCESGAVTALPSEEVEGASRLRLTFDPYQAFWLVFDPEREPLPSSGDEREPRVARVALAGPWRVSCNPAIQPPPVSPGANLEIPADLTVEGGVERPLASWLDWGLPGFSGFLDYRTTFTMDAPSGRVLVDLGDVRFLAEVTVNGQSAGARLWPPFEYDVTGLVRAGENELTVRVGNLLVNAMRRYETWGWTRPAAGDFRAGLFGPVTIARQ